MWLSPTRRNMVRFSDHTPTAWHPASTLNGAHVFGVDADGAVAQLVIDFMVLVDQDDDGVLTHR